MQYVNIENGKYIARIIVMLYIQAVVYDMITVAMIQQRQSLRYQVGNDGA